MRPDCAVIATMHGKETVIAPLLQGALGLRTELPTDFDTDCFGTFSGDVPRVDTALATARAKIAAAFKQVPHAHIGIASEGSFGPHPLLPMIPIDNELLLLIDRRAGIEVAGHHATPRTNYAHCVVTAAEAAVAFAQRIGFPAHGLIVIGALDGKPAPAHMLRKNLTTLPELLVAVADGIAVCGAAMLQTDMRAHRNPTRMRAIRRATIDLVRRYRSRCPRCARAGFVITERLPGLPCPACNAPTRMLRATASVCTGCGCCYEQAGEAASADPDGCDHCNPQLRVVNRGMSSPHHAQSVRYHDCCPRAYCQSLYASTGMQAHITFLSPCTLSTRATGGQYLTCLSTGSGNAASSRG